MSLTRRVSLFFLGALAVCLLGYSLGLYVIVDRSLAGQAQQERDVALNTLAAAVEVEDDDVKWQPADHEVILSRAVSQDHLRWIVIDEAGQLVDHSRNILPVSSKVTDPKALLQAGNRETWEIAKQTLRASSPKSPSEREPGDFESLTVMVATSSLPMRATLSRFAATLAALSALIWGLAATLGLRYCRRALQPLMRMLAEVRSTASADFHLRLSVSPHQDELGELAIAFNQLLQQLQDAFDRQQQFAGHAAHQLRTPLTVLRGQLEVCLRRERSTAEYQTTLQATHDQTLNLQELVESLLLLVGPHQHMPREMMEERAVGPWITEILSHWQNEARGDDLRIIADDHALLTTAWPLLAQVLNNLVENAFKYSQAGTPVTVTVENAADSVAFAVQDQGAGIPPNEQAMIFDPFYRSASARRLGATGIGLGLAVAARIVQTLGGRIAVVSLPETGTTFRVEFPKSPN